MIEQWLETRRGWGLRLSQTEKLLCEDDIWENEEKEEEEETGNDGNEERIDSRASWGFLNVKIVCFEVYARASMNIRTRMEYVREELLQLSNAFL